MEKKETAIPGVFVLAPRVFGDSRGWFYESYNAKVFSGLGICANFVQDNESFSCYGVLRGLHFQKGEFAQAKLVRVLAGRVLDVAVDIRAGSPTFGKHVAVELSAESASCLSPVGLHTVSLFCQTPHTLRTSATTSTLRKVKALSSLLTSLLALIGSFLERFADSPIKTFLPPLGKRTAVPPCSDLRSNRSCCSSLEQTDN